ncbi:hypothetical protein HZC21_00740 [Candidatus Peregrinibacteria bacterium]|nr:hypothetical protein [Candidatus Peregrinibacteria bacterium]
MLKNLHFKILALVFAAIFWAFVVSMENTFFKLTETVPIKVFNQSEDLALTSDLGNVELILRADDSVVTKTLSASDFEAYVDLKNAGAGNFKTSVFVTSKNPRVSVLKIEPAEVEIELESVEEKTIAVSSAVKGEPANGFELKSAKLSVQAITVSAASSVLKKIGQAKAEIKLRGTEEEDFEAEANVKVYDREGNILEGVFVKTEDVKIAVKIIETESVKQVGIKANLVGEAENMTVKKVEVNPAVVLVQGQKEVLGKIEIIETEKIDLKGAQASFEKKVKIVLPTGVSLAEGEKAEVSVKVSVEKE